jgi:cytochrome c6
MALTTTIPVAALVVAAWMAGGVKAGSTAPQAIKGTFASKCASCHAIDGSGSTAKGKELKLKDMRSAEVQAMTDDKLYEVIAKGKGKMPGYEKTLGADKCHELVTYIRSLAKKS